MTPAEVAAELLTEFDAAGVALHVTDGRLRAWPSAAITPEVRAIIEPHRAALVAAVIERDAVIGGAIDEAARLGGWSAADAAFALDVAHRSTCAADWLALVELMRASGSCDGALPMRAHRSAGDAGFSVCARPDT